jgi:CRP-like cAMP-binding protein
MSPFRKNDFKDNNLLKKLRPEDFELLLSHFEKIKLEAGRILYEAGDIVHYAYFPCGGTLVSYVVSLDDARGVETALIGREGAAGGIVSEGNLPAYCRSIVQIGGPAYRIELSALERAKEKSPALKRLFSRYADCLIAQVFQSVACNATHTIEQRAAKWLIAVQTRTGDNTIELTQEQLGGMLGVGRSYVTRVLGLMKQRDILGSIRGKLTIKNFDELNKLSCSCNAAVEAHFEEVLNGVYPKERR